MKKILLLFYIIFLLSYCVHEHAQVENQFIPIQLDSLVIIFGAIQSAPDSILSPDQKAYTFNFVNSLVYNLNFDSLKKFYFYVYKNDSLSNLSRIKLNGMIDVSIRKYKKDGLKKLISLSNSPKEIDKMFVADLLVNYKSFFAEKVLERLLSDSSGAVKISAINSLAYLNYKRLKPYLSDFINYTNFEIKLCTILVQYKYDKENTIPLLIEFLDDPNFKTRETVYKILKHEIKNDFGYNPSASKSERLKSIEKYSKWREQH